MSNFQTPPERKQSASGEGLEQYPKPPWLKVKLPACADFFQVAELLKSKRLSTICQSARCPNVPECWSSRTATFLLLGDICTRNCGFCAVPGGIPQSPSPDEPHRVAETIGALGLDYAVLTSVARDDLPDGGAAHFAATVRAIKARNPRIKVEVLIPDFQGDRSALAVVIQADPDVLNHNLETTERCYALINRPTGNYRRSLELLRQARDMGALTKSGLMVGLGEDEADILQTMQDLIEAGCRLLTIGQYLRPTRDHAPTRKYYYPDEFDRFSNIARGLGLRHVEAGPLVRSSYQAARMFKSIARGRG